MFCYNCGQELESNANFCAFCGSPADNDKVQSFECEEKYIDGEKGDVIRMINGEEINLSEIIINSGKDKISAIKYLKLLTNISLAEAKCYIDDAYSQSKEDEETNNIKKKGFWEQAREDAIKYNKSVEEYNNRKVRIQEMDNSGTVYCPKCKSTCVTANKKGFGVGKGTAAGLTGFGIGASIASVV